MPSRQEWTDHSLSRLHHSLSSPHFAFRVFPSRHSPQAVRRVRSEAASLLLGPKPESCGGEVSVETEHIAEAGLFH